MGHTKATAGKDKLGADSIARRTRKSRQAPREGHAAPVNADERNDAANGDEEDPENQSGSDQEGDTNDSDDNAAGEMGVEEVGEGPSEVKEAVGEVEQNEEDVDEAGDAHNAEAVDDEDSASDSDSAQYSAQGSACSRGSRVDLNQVVVVAPISWHAGWAAWQKYFDDYCE
ncbi:hypothetical protein L914_01764 [Phytophthora nicotianae]|uniref:Uncharacterized protein n=1 Tax=Phytophthora nicotianae TaxID=4792 RepID=W2P3Y9_PHYNI|nr:hypothetical protein L914_01764 [Phytophthora nicotianae]